MKQINANLENIKKTVFQYIMGYSNEIYRKNDSSGEFAEGIIKELIKMEKISQLAGLLIRNTTVTKEYATSYVIGFCLWDGKAVFKIGSYYFSVKLSYGSLLPYFNRISLEESYDIIKTANFTDRDYSDEEEHISVSYHETLEPTANKQTIIEVDEEVLVHQFTDADKDDLIMIMTSCSTLDILYALESAIKGEAIIKTEKETLNLKELSDNISNPY